MALFLGLERAAVVDPGTCQNNVIGDALFEKADGLGESQTRESAAAARGKVEIIVDAQNPRKSVRVVGLIAPAAGASHVDGAVDVGPLQAGVLDRKAGRLGGKHALGSARLWPGYDPEPHDGVFTRIRMSHSQSPFQDLLPMELAYLNQREIRASD